jgi:hypothetical protein
LGTFVSATAKTVTASVTVTSAAGEIVYDVATFQKANDDRGSGANSKYNINSGAEIKGGGASTKPGAASVTMTGMDLQSRIGPSELFLLNRRLVNFTYFTLTPSFAVLYY